MQTKPAYQSKTIWFNLITIFFTVVTYYGWTPNQHLTTVVTGFLVVASPFINFALRFVTHKAIAPKN